MTAHPTRSFIGDAVSAPLHVIIIGGGIGGLTLAQGLKKSGVSAAVYERDRTRTDRVQGYRVHINLTGSLALHECLSARLFEAFTRMCGRPAGGIRFVTEQIKVLLALDGRNAPAQFTGNGVAQHRSVSRITLRQVLLSGLEDAVHFGKTFVRYEERPLGRIVAHFEDGSTAEGDVLVAADGGGSRVRRQFLPHAERIDTGIVAIAGKVFLNNESRRLIAPELTNALTLASGKGGYSLFVALQDFDGVALNGIDGNDESAAAGNHFDNSRSYLMWAFGARREKLGLDGGDIEQMSSEELRTTALRAMAQRSWDQRFRALVRLADTDTINAIAIRTSVPIEANATGHAPRRRDPCDDALSRYRRQRCAQRRSEALPRADNGKSRQASSNRCDSRLRDRHDRLRFPRGTDVAPRHAPGGHGGPGSADAVARHPAHHQLRSAT